jgi:hypothetical protein
MKQQVTLTLEKENIPGWKAQAKSLGISFSALVERKLGTPNPSKPFSEFCADLGIHAPVELDDNKARAEGMKKKYGEYL